MRPNEKLSDPAEWVVERNQRKRVKKETSNAEQSPGSLERMVRAQFGEPIMDDEQCDECDAGPLPVWAGLKPDGEWTQMCARCVLKHDDVRLLRSNEKGQR
jgi:hypothetical protein